MKNKLSLIIGATLLATAAGSIAQTAVTDPVGYVTTTVAPGNGAALRAETLYGVTLFNKVEFSGVAASATGTTINFSGTPLTAGAYGPTFFLEITNGAGEGLTSNIVSNTASAVVTSKDLSAAITATSTVKIRAHHTVSSVFGATNTAGLLAGASLDDADQIVILNPVTQVPKTIFYSTDEFAPGWIDAAQNPAGDEIIAPGQGVLIKRKGNTSLNVIQVGHVKRGKTAVEIELGENIVSVPLATGVTVGNSGLDATVTKGAQLGDADQLVAGNGPNLFTTLFNSTDEFAQGWIDAAQNPQTDFLLKEGTAVLLKNNAPSTGNTKYFWTFPAQFVQE